MQALLTEWGLPTTEATIENVFARAYEALKGPHVELAKTIPLEPRLNIDETGWRINGERFNIWIFSTPSLSYLKVAKSRGDIVLNDVPGKDYGGTIISDFLITYAHYLGQHCLAHLSRDLKACLEEKDNECRAIAIESLGCIHDVWDMWRHYRRGGMNLEAYREQTKELIKEFKQFLETLPAELPASAQKLRKRLRVHLPSTYREGSSEHGAAVTPAE